MRILTKRRPIERTIFACLGMMLCLAFGSGTADAQLLKQSDYGVGVTIAIYQYDDTSSKPFTQVNKLLVTATTPEEEIEHIARTFGVEGLKIRHIRTIGLREGESFTDTQPMNDKPFVFTILPRIITKGDVTFDFTAGYDEKVLLELKSVSVNSYETVMLRGSQGAFGIREFQGPDGAETAPDKRALLVTITPTVTTTRSLQNRASDISRPTDAYGSRVELGDSDIFVMPALISRAPLNFSPGARVKGSITLEGIVTPDGRITNVRVLDTPDSALNPKAIEAFRQFRFTPAKLNGRPTYSTFRETFQLGKPSPL